MLVLALGFQRYQRRHIGSALPLNDAYWFSYITTTTVGFGDIHISHSEFTVAEMFFVPFLVLLGFNFLGIFADKCIYLYNDWFPEKRGFTQILAERRGDHHPITQASEFRGDTSKPRQGRARHRKRSSRLDAPSAGLSNASGNSVEARQSRSRDFDSGRRRSRDRPSVRNQGQQVVDTASNEYEDVVDC